MDLAGATERLRAAGCVFAGEEAALLAAAAGGSTLRLDELVRQRAAGTPLEHLVGWAEFCGERLTVRPGVFVPRPRTEFLVDVAAGVTPRSAVVVDLCCGAGAVGRALGALISPAELHACDLSADAVACARENLAALGGTVHQGDLYDALPASLRGRVDVIVANAPYVPSDEIRLMPSEARDHEPRAALDGGADGVDVHRRIAAGAGPWLSPGGHVLIETSRRQADRTAGALADHGFRTRVRRDPERDATVVSGRR